MSGTKGNLDTLVDWSLEGVIKDLLPVPNPDKLMPSKGVKLSIVKLLQIAD